MFVCFYFMREKFSKLVAFILISALIQQMAITEHSKYKQWEKNNNKLGLSSAKLKAQLALNS